jgi:hypothetical protein
MNKYSNHSKADISYIFKKVENSVNQCLRKRVYVSQGIALQTASNILKDKGTPMRAYHCPKCFKWHLTSKV